MANKLLAELQNALAEAAKAAQSSSADATANTSATHDSAPVDSPAPRPRQSGNGRASQPPRSNSTPLRLYLFGALGLFLLLSVFRSFVLVGSGERAVVFNRFSGTQRGQLGEGLHFVMPWVQSTTRYDVKSETYTMSDNPSEANAQAGNANDGLEALTRDGLPVKLEMSARFHPDPENVWRLHQNIGPDYVSKVVRPQVRSHARMIVAMYPVTDVYGPRRAQMVEQINTRLRTLLAQNDLILDEVLLRDVSFSDAFQAAIEQKQVAQQDVARMTFVLESAQKERQRKIIEAQGEAASIRLKANALAKNPGLTQYEYVQRLPNDTRTVITDGRTIVNLGNSNDATTSAAAQDAPQPAPTSPARGEQP